MRLKKHIFILFITLMFHNWCSGQTIENRWTFSDTDDNLYKLPSSDITSLDDFINIYNNKYKVVTKEYLNTVTNITYEKKLNSFKDDSIFFSILKYFPNLKTLSIYCKEYPVQINFNGIQNINNLRYLYIHFAPYEDFPEAFPEAFFIPVHESISKIFEIPNFDSIKVFITDYPSLYYDTWMNKINQKESIIEFLNYPISDYKKIKNSQNIITSTMYSNYYLIDQYFVDTINNRKFESNDSYSVPEFANKKNKIQKNGIIKLYDKRDNVWLNGNMNKQKLDGWWITREYEMKDTLPSIYSYYSYIRPHGIFGDYISNPSEDAKRELEYIHRYESIPFSDIFDQIYIKFKENNQDSLAWALYRIFADEPNKYDKICSLYKQGDQQKIETICLQAFTEKKDNYPCRYVTEKKVYYNNNKIKIIDFYKYNYRDDIYERKLYYMFFDNAIYTIKSENIHQYKTDTLKTWVIKNKDNILRVDFMDNKNPSCTIFTSNYPHPVYYKDYERYNIINTDTSILFYGKDTINYYLYITPTFYIKWDKKLNIIELNSYNNEINLSDFIQTDEYKKIYTSLKKL